MQSGGFLGFVATLLVLVRSVCAFSNTSPMIVLSDAKPLDVSIVNAEDPMALSVDRVLEAVVTGAARGCEYNAYIFVNHPNVSERDITKQSMPFLTNALKKAEGRFVTDVALESETAETSVSTLQDSILNECNAIRTSADINSETPLKAISDKKTRLITVDFPSGTPVGDADEVLRKVVGHLATGNFLLTYRTTPKSSARNEDGRVTSSSSAAGSGSVSVSSDDTQVPYESVFRNYQFFSPALFMGLLVSALLIVIFLIALNSVNSLQISTAAFEPKRQQPAKKQ